MAKVSLKNMAGEQVGDLDLKAEVFGVELNIPLMHQAVVAEEANMRQGTADTKSRAEVSGGGAKPYRQKGTGRARQGSTRAPHYYHGGVTFGPTPRSYDKALPKKMRRGALRSALSAKVADESVIVVDEIKLDSISTKKMAALLKGLEATGKALVVLDGVTEEILKSSRNIPRLLIRVAPAVSVRDILNADKIVMTRGAVAKLEEVFA
ncbi:MAG: 50S ribosomal protein L4 [Armatimonadota bacterium]|nr:50S ribosomal protein L4 [bacterium]